jgi:succinate dehydrogenase / fumarate reductase, flavoprotein subunit
MYEEITAENPYQMPMRIYPAPHYTMGGLWVDYDLMSTIPGLFIAGEANFSDHGANRLGASALMQGLADGYFIVPRVVSSFLARSGKLAGKTDTEAFGAVEAEVKDRYARLLSIKGDRTVREYWWDLGRIMWDKVGMSRNRESLESAIAEIAALREAYWQNVRVPGESNDLNKHLEMAGRVADFLELGELMARDALMREESCGGHFREEHQTEEGEARRDDRKFAFVGAWEYTGEGREPVLHKEELVFENVELKTRSYK